MSAGVIPVAWRTRATPLAPIAAAASGGEARRLAARLLVHVARLPRLRGVARAASGEEVLVVLGESNDLPWSDEIVYLGQDPRAPSLLMPTTLEPEVDGADVSALLERALLRRGQAVAPLAVLPAPGLVVPCGSALAVDAGELAKIFALGGAR